MTQCTIAKKRVSVYPSAAPNKPVLYLHTYADEGDAAYRAMQQAGCPDFTLIAISGLDWNRDMVPWDIPPVTGQGMPCTGGADAYLRCLLQEILPEAERAVRGRVPWRGIAGYSLGGLFALYALCRSDCFARAASMSGSLWFPNFSAYIQAHGMQNHPSHVYFSLGSKESKARNRYLRTVRQNTGAIEAFYRSQGVDTALAIHPGGHNQDVPARIAAGLAWLLQR